MCQASRVAGHTLSAQPVRLLHAHLPAEGFVFSWGLSEHGALGIGFVSEPQSNPVRVPHFIKHGIKV